MLCALAAMWGTTPASRAQTGLSTVPLVEATGTPTRAKPAVKPRAATPPRLKLPIHGIPPAPNVTPPAGAQAHLIRGKGINRRPIATAAEGSFRIQLASVRTRAAAAHEEQRLRHRFAAELRGLTLAVEPVEHGSREQFRIVSEALADREQARDRCAPFRSTRAGCLVLATRGASAPAAAIAAGPAPSPRAKSVATAAETGGVRAQLASVRSLAQATHELHRLSHRYADVLKRTPLVMSRIDQGERGTFYRIVTAPLPNRAAASGLCQRIGSPKSCLLIPERGRET
jgi:SPOR domain